MKSDGSQRQLIRAVVLGGTAALASAWIAWRPDLDAHTLSKAGILVCITVLAELISIRLPHGATSEQITLGEVAIAADVALLPAPIAPIVAIAGLTISLIVRRKSFVKIAYNGAQYAIATVAAAAVFHGIGGGDVETAAGLAALFAGMAAFAGSNLLTISAMFATISGQKLVSVVREEYRVSLAVALGNSSVGIVAVGLWLARPMLVPAILAPAMAVHLAYRGWIRQMEFTTEIADQKEKLERIVAHSSEGIVLADATGTVVLWSPSMERISGLTATEAEGKSLSYLLRGTAASGASVHVEIGGQDVVLQVARADGSERWLRVQHGPAHDEEGTLRWDVVVVHDVTTEHDTEKMKEHFLATVSHELRTPLTPIIGYAKFLLRREDVPPDVRRDALASLLDQAVHMQRLVEDLLLASMVGGNSTVHARREPVDLNAVVSRTVAATRSSHAKREILIQSDGALLAVGDAVRIMQVVANLLDNALKYSPEETPVEISLERDGEHVVLSVTDHGRGIPDDKQDEIFTKFRRLENPNTMETGGPGLGLFIVDQLVRAMGGTVTVTSRPGQGSTFSVRLAAMAGGAGEQATIERSA
ncbi:MAG: PAS domain-containing sensor histidine kinase [Actinomycetota bacterium]